jgi:hypothetical protein
MFETLEDCGLESSEAWNNAGTGHAANCEMNYAPERSDGSVDISKALQVNVEFDLSRQFWTYLIKKGAIADPRSFIHPVPRMSFVHGEANVSFLRKRFNAMTAHHCYYGMEYTEDSQKIAEWTPLVMEGRSGDEPVAATRIITGTDVDYGSLTHHLVHHLVGLPGLRSTLQEPRHLPRGSSCQRTCRILRMISDVSRLSGGPAPVCKRLNASWRNASAILSRLARAVSRAASLTTQAASLIGHPPRDRVVSDRSSGSCGRSLSMLERFRDSVVHRQGQNAVANTLRMGLHGSKETKHLKALDNLRWFC